MSSTAPNANDSAHGTPPDGLTCMCTMDDITLEDENYVEYQCYPSLKWKPAQYEQSVIEQLLQDQFQQYLDRVKKTDCQAELRRLLATGPPVYIQDQHALALDEGDTHVVQLWFSSDKQERSAKLVGAVEGEAREKLWEELNAFIIEEGKEAGDDDDNSGIIQR